MAWHIIVKPQAHTYAHIYLFNYIKQKNHLLQEKRQELRSSMVLHFVP